MTSQTIIEESSARPDRQTRSIFVEYANPSVTPQYTLKEEDVEFSGKTYPSLYRLYVELEDVTEYLFANEYLHGFTHWERICAQDWFKPYIEKWRRHLDLKLFSRALQELKAIANDRSHPGYLQANKYILSRGWESRKGAGRPSKKEVEKAAKTLAADERKLLDDYHLLEE